MVKVKTEFSYPTINDKVVEKIGEIGDIKFYNVVNDDSDATIYLAKGDDVIGNIYVSAISEMGVGAVVNKIQINKAV